MNTCGCSALQLGPEHQSVAAVLEYSPLQPKSDLLGHPLRWLVLGADDRDQVGHTGYSSCLADRHRRLGGQALAPASEVHVVAHFDEQVTLDVLNGEPAVADEVAIVCLYNPETMAVVRVVPLVPRDPVLGVGPR